MARTLASWHCPKVWMRVCSTDIGVSTGRRGAAGPASCTGSECIRACSQEHDRIQLPAWSDVAHRESEKPTAMHRLGLPCASPWTDAEHVVEVERVQNKAHDGGIQHPHELQADEASGQRRLALVSGRGGPAQLQAAQRRAEPGLVAACRTLGLSGQPGDICAVQGVCSCARMLERNCGVLRGRLCGYPSLFRRLSIQGREFDIRPHIWAPRTLVLRDLLSVRRSSSGHKPHLWLRVRLWSSSLALCRESGDRCERLKHLCIFVCGGQVAHLGRRCRVQMAGTALFRGYEAHAALMRR